MSGNERQDLLQALRLILQYRTGNAMELVDAAIQCLEIRIHILMKQEAKSEDQQRQS